MTTYRLNENWSSFEVGDKFKLGAYGDGDLYQLIDNSDNYVLARIPTDLLDEINDSGYWKPMDGEKFYYIDENGDVLGGVFSPNASSLDMDTYSLGNCFRTREDAQAVVDRLKARQRLIESGARFVNSQDISGSENYFNVYFSVNGGGLMINDVFLGKHVVFSRELCFDNKHVARKSIKEHKNDWLTYLGVKEKNDERTDV